MLKNVLLLSLLIPFCSLFSSQTNAQTAAAQTASQTVLPKVAYIELEDITQNLDEVKALQKELNDYLESQHKYMEEKQNEIENIRKKAMMLDAEIQKTKDATDQAELTKKKKELQQLGEDFNQKFSFFANEQNRIQQEAFGKTEQNAKDIKNVVEKRLRQYGSEHKIAVLIEGIIIDDEMDSSSKIISWVNKKYKAEQEEEAKKKKNEKKK